MKRLIPDVAETTVAEQLGAYRPWEDAGPGDRPLTAVNFAVTLDGRATIEGRSGQIGSDTDTEMLQTLRTRFDAVMVGAGTLRTERYGRVVPDESRRAGRVADDLAEDPLAVVVSNRMELPWDAGLFTCGAGRVLVHTSSDEEPPATETPVEVVRHEGGVDLSRAMRELRSDHGIRALLCEGGPALFGDLVASGLVDELFLTIAPKLAGTAGPSLIEAELGEAVELGLRWLLSADGELFARYAVAGPSAQ